MMKLPDHSEDVNLFALLGKVCDFVDGQAKASKLPKSSPGRGKLTAGKACKIS
jgi:hypothetical protein